MGILVNFELDLVEIKVQELHRLVDIFVIVESNVTLGTVFIGNPTECVTDRYRPDLWLRIYIIESRWLFLGQFWPHLKQVLFLEAAGAVLKIGSILKPNHQKEI